MYACQHGSVESTKLYISHGAKLDMKVSTVEYYSALYHAICQDTGGRTALNYAKMSGNAAVIALFPTDAPIVCMRLCMYEKSTDAESPGNRL